MHWYDFDLFDPAAETQRVIRARQTEIVHLKRKERKLARKGMALQVLQVQRQIAHLEKLNAQGRGNTEFTLPHKLRTLENRPLW